MVSSPRSPRSLRAARTRALAVPAALAVSALVVWQGSYAAFSATTSNPKDSWSTGVVVLSDDDAGSALFSVTGIKPGGTGQRCIRVTSTSTVYGPVRMWFSNVSANALSTNATQGLRLQIQLGTAASGGSAASCTGFVAASTPFNGVLRGLSTRTSWATGIASWTPVATPTSRVYRLTWSLPAAATAAVAGQTATAAITWETRV